MGVEICYNISLSMKTIKLPFRVKRPILACGADMKVAFAIAGGNKAYLFDGPSALRLRSGPMVSLAEPSAGSGPVPSLSRDGFGDLSDLDNYTRYENAVREAEKSLRIIPKIVVCDLHPGYFSTQFAKNYTQYACLPGRQAIRTTYYEVQHHEAHVASAIIDNDIKGEVLGVAFDGTGYGLDDNIWGGEFFIGGLKNLKRVAHLDYIPMPGGEACIKEPWRMAASYLYSAFGENFLKSKIDFIKNIDKKRWTVLKGMIDKKINSPLTSSAGRFFDVAACLILNKHIADFEAELPIELERIAGTGVNDTYDSIKPVKIIKGIVRDIEKNVAAPVISAKFHNSIAVMILSAAKKAKIKKVVLSGGVFQNRYLVDRAVNLLSRNSFKAYVHRNMQTNDSGIPIGQIAIANARASAFASNEK